MKVSLLLFLALSAASCFASTDCQSTFTKGAGPTTITFCVSDTGNIAFLNSGQLLIDKAEGYAVCYGSNSYYDMGIFGDSGNWLAPTITQPNGPNTFPLTITRKSADALFTLTQSYLFSSSGKGVRVTMSVSNIGGYVVKRFAIPPIVSTSHFADHTIRSAFIWTQGGFGLTAAPIPSPMVNAQIIYGSNPQNPCTAAVVTQLPYPDAAGTLLTFGSNGGKKQNLIFDYIPMW